MADQPRATVRVVNGKLVLDDPDALGMIEAVEVHNRGLAKQACREFFEANADRVAHFARRVRELGKAPTEVVIVILDVDDSHGADLADVLMPNSGGMWQDYRARGLKPVARGLAVRAGIQEAVDLLDAAEGARLRDERGLAAVVVAHGTVSVFSVPEGRP